MSSGEFDTIRIDDITIARDERIRKALDPAKLAELADSIKRLGLLHPPVITRERVLVVGETRLEACRSLGWDSISIQWADTLEPDLLLAMELEENLKRTALTWQEECDTIRRFHELKKRTELNWTLESTAAALGVSEAKIIRSNAVARAIAAGVPRVADAPKYSVAVNLVARHSARAAADELQSVAAVEAEPAPPTPFLNANFNDWALTYDGPPFNFIHCDFPYGIGADNFNQGAASSFGGYADSFDVYSQLISTLIVRREALLGASGHIMFWFSMRHYDHTLRVLRDAFWVDPYPLIWAKSDNRGILPDPKRGPRRVYETAFLCSHGDRPIISPVSNVFSAPTTRVSEHMSEKNVEMLQHFFRMVVDENTRMLDPTCGGGSSLRAARSMGATNLLGLEINPEFHANAERAWNAKL